jgi:signal transduction histidine kinase
MPRSLHAPAHSNSVEQAQQVPIPCESFQQHPDKQQPSSFNRALLTFVELLARSPDRMFHHLADAARTLCGARTVAVNLSEESEGGAIIFRWVAVYGQPSTQIWGTTAQEQSVCGPALKAETVRLWALGDCLAPIHPQGAEALFIPFSINGQTAGTMWIIPQSQEQFGAAEVEIAHSLTKVTVAAYRNAHAHRTLKNANTLAKTAIRDLVHINRELEQTAVELTAINDNLEDFAYKVSHDLQEPLRTMSTSAQLLRRHLNGALDEHTDEIFNLMTDGCSRMSQLIADLLTYSKHGHRNAEEFEVTNLQNALLDTTANLDRVIKDHHATITSDALPTVRGNRAQLGLLLQNLILNAIKYRHRTRTPKIHLSAERIDNGWVVSVRDNGQGFDQKDAEKIFLAFKRLHGPEVPGSGLGLALCRKILLNHGGTIFARSSPGEGSTFQFTLIDLVADPPAESARVLFPADDARQSKCAHKPVDLAGERCLAKSNRYSNGS